MTVLYIILGIIAFICLVLLVKVRIDAEYIDGFKLSVSWLFLHFSIYPKTQKEKKPPKPKKAVVTEGDNKTETQNIQGGASK